MTKTPDPDWADRLAFDLLQVTEKKALVTLRQKRLAELLRQRVRPIQS